MPQPLHKITSVPSNFLAKPVVDTTNTTKLLLAKDRAKAADSLLALRHALSLHTDSITNKLNTSEDN